jgi:hypothetical protein
MAIEVSQTFLFYEDAAYKDTVDTKLLAESLQI